MTDLGTVFREKNNIVLFDELQYFTGLTSIEKYAFQNCSFLTSITIPSSVTNIGDVAFSSCTGLPVENNLRYADTYLVEAVDKTRTTYTIKTGTRFIGTYAFQDCSFLSSITIPSSVTSIGEQAFEYCSSQISITIPSSVTSIGADAFHGCEGLTSITIPESVTSIGTYAFEYCTSLTSITIPNSVTSIGSGAFSGCSGLTSVTIPSSVTSIGTYAFEYCSGLTSVTVENPIPVTIEYFTFTNRSNATLYVPLGSKSAYQAEQHWKDFKEIIEYDNRLEQTLSLMEIPSKTYGDAAYTLPETTAEGLTITWSSSDTMLPPSAAIH